MRSRHLSSLLRHGGSLLLILPALLLGARPAAATAPLVTIARVDPVGPQNPPTVTAHVTVANASGIPVGGLTAGNFSVSEDGKPVSNLNVSSSANAVEPLRVALALDTSGSMAGKPLADAENASHAFVGLLGPNDPVAVFSFGDSVPSEIDLSPDHDAANATIDGLRVGGNTPLYDAVFAAVSAVASQPSGRRAVLVMTDGEDTSSVKTLDDAIKHAQDANVPVFAVGLGYLDAAPLQRLADTTGGQLLTAPSSAELTDRFQQIGALLRQEYVLTFNGEGRNVASERELQIAVNVNGDTGQASARYQAPATISQHVSGRFVTPTEGQRVRGTVHLEAAITPQVSARGARFFFDDKLIGTAGHAPYAVDWSTRGVLTGGHILRADVTGMDGQTESVQEVVTLVSSDSGTPFMLGIVGLLGVLGAVLAAMLFAHSRQQEVPVLADGGNGSHATETTSTGDGIGSDFHGNGAVQSAWLVEEQPDGTRLPWPLTQDETLIGREVTSPHILLDDVDVSRRHAAVRRENGDLVFHDLGPTNPSTINGQRYSGPHPLQDGDEVVVGNTRLVFTSRN